jgi:hypothetical protein
MDFTMDSTADSMGETMSHPDFKQAAVSAAAWDSPRAGCTEASAVAVVTGK